MHFAKYSIMVKRLGIRKKEEHRYQFRCVLFETFMEYFSMEFAGVIRAQEDFEDYKTQSEILRTMYHLHRTI